MRFILTMLLTAAVLAGTCHGAVELPIEAPSACLVEQVTGTVLYEKDAHARRHIASVTKVMTLLLIMEAIDTGVIGWDTPVTASPNAASMGGSQIWLEAGETMTVEEMVKCITVVSANDCSVAMAEHLAGSEAAFAQRMNDTAARLGLTDTHFVNCTGLFDDPEHYSSAYDIAMLSRRLMTYDKIRQFTTIWTDTARDGAFGLSNTNKLIRWYDGATGLKTGFTDGAMYCLAATAERRGEAYAAVVLGCDTSQHRFDSARVLLDHAFATYTLLDLRSQWVLPPVPVRLGQQPSVQPVYPESGVTVLEKSRLADLRYEQQLEEWVEAPVEQGQQLGTLTVYAGDEQLAQFPLTAVCAVERQSLWSLYGRLWALLLGFGQ